MILPIRRQRRSSAKCAGIVFVILVALLELTCELPSEDSGMPSEEETAVECMSKEPEPVRGGGDKSIKANKPAEGKESWPAYPEENRESRQAVAVTVDLELGRRTLPCGLSSAWSWRSDFPHLA